MRHAALFAAFLAIAALAVPARAQDGGERLLDFSSDITVNTDGTLNVAETIAVNAQGDRINHGIYRDFPTLYTDKFGRRVRVRFDVQSVTMDGHDEHYEVDGIDNGKRVKIGDADTSLDYGKHVYVIRYTTDRQIGFFDGFDELYWNVTGNGWDFTIDHAEATVHLPPKARILQSAFYTGPEGGAGKEATAQQISDHEIRFSTTSGLGSLEGLTFAVGFTKGVVAPPTGAQSFWEFVRDNADSFIAVLGIVALFIYYMIAWVRFGRDPQHGTIIPLFSPPKDFSPSAVRYVHRMAYDNKAYAAALIDMAVKGFMKIAEDGKSYKLTRTGKSAQECGLSPGESGVATALFSSGNEIELKQINHSDIADSIAALQGSLKNEYDIKYFVTNFGWFLGGVAILAATIALSALLSDNGAANAGLLLFAGGFSVAAIFLIYRAFDAWRTAVSAQRGRTGGIFGAIFLTLFALPFTGIALGTLIGLGASTASIAAALILGGIMVVVFFHLLKAPTALGGHIRDEIDGFKIFLDTAEKDRLEKLNPPEVTPAVFEKFLPYAIALDCENQWSRKFEAEAAAAAAAGSSAYNTYTPIWYSGNSFANLGAAGFVSSIGSSLGSVASSSSSAPGSSSGSGGGGFSGGGGGGGGGGGW
ncbi:MAG TPA: DUF2207 domain-containing protein [Rhizomicrobium sp.]|nr:DUF2207 domain-containing protein [Rhizomicrobium sp.]